MPILHAQLSLHAMVNGVGGVAILDYPAEIAISITNRISELIGPRRARRPGSGTWRLACWNQVAEPVVSQRQKVWVPVDFLEVANIVVPHVTDFRCHLAADLALDAQVPLLRVGIAEVGTKLKLGGEAGIPLRR